MRTNSTYEERRRAIEEKIAKIQHINPIYLSEQEVKDLKRKTLGNGASLPHSVNSENNRNTNLISQPPQHPSKPAKPQLNIQRTYLTVSTDQFRLPYMKDYKQPPPIQNAPITEQKNQSTTQALPPPPIKANNNEGPFKITSTVKQPRSLINLQPVELEVTTKIESKSMQIEEKKQIGNASVSNEQPPLNKASSTDAPQAHKKQSSGFPPLNVFGQAKGINSIFGNSFANPLGGQKISNIFFKEGPKLSQFKIVTVKPLLASSDPNPNISEKVQLFSNANPDFIPISKKTASLENTKEPSQGSFSLFSNNQSPAMENYNPVNSLHSEQKNSSNPVFFNKTLQNKVAPLSFTQTTPNNSLLTSTFASGPAKSAAQTNPNRVQQSKNLFPAPALLTSNSAFASSNPLKRQAPVQTIPQQSQNKSGASFKSDGSKQEIEPAKILPALFTPKVELIAPIKTETNISQSSAPNIFKNAQKGLLTKAQTQPQTTTNFFTAKSSGTLFGGQTVSQSQGLPAPATGQTFGHADKLPAQRAGNLLFGQQVGSQPQGGVSLFGRATNTPLFGQPTNSSLFGKSEGGSLFGSVGIQSQGPANNQLFPSASLGGSSQGSLFGGVQSSMFGKSTQSQELKEDEEEEGDDNPQGIDTSDPALSTGSYNYIKSKEIFKEQANKFRLGNRSTLDNTSVSIEQFENPPNKFLFVRMPNKCLNFCGKFIPGTTFGRFLNKGTKNVEIINILDNTEGVREVSLPRLKVQFKDDETGKRFLTMVEEAIKNSE